MSKQRQGAGLPGAGGRPGPELVIPVSIHCGIQGARSHMGPQHLLQLSKDAEWGGRGLMAPCGPGSAASAVQGTPSPPNPWALARSWWAVEVVVGTAGGALC